MDGPPWVAFSFSDKILQFPEDNRIHPQNGYRVAWLIPYN
ncbi:hypothetical protein MICA_1699 [Micavibrio aeruginosavorus ARL-13]|uniref:Uncharacterized protein n=1 Tax=Micavibrio aeruginosavorus (strain ARL-13) TaxID=856793 RepID=G2KRQ4_MICAA|nr:hypothetical protein MICA_1699 [Micavibrio aeruginosavorus ARL-13]